MNDEIREIEAEILRLKGRLSEARRRGEPELIANYRLTRANGDPVDLADLFGDKRDLLVIHNMGRGCVYCTMWADGFASMLPHLEDRTAVVLISPDEPAVQSAFAASRDWPFAMVSAAGTSFIADLGFADDGGGYLPGVSALHLDANDSIVRTGRDEFGPGDDYAPAWRLFDLLQDGAGNWEPKFQY
jgi:predicted dithiol-disulfide oxidoreductase (DUF899 family)